MRYRSTLVYLVAALVLGGVYFLDVRSEKKEETRKEEAKVLFQEMPEDLTRLAIKRGERTVVLEKTGDGEADDAEAWAVTAPVKTDADGYCVNRITSLLPHLKYTRIIHESTDDPASFGLDSPALTLTWTGKGREGTLSIGGESPIDKGFYAKTSDGPRVFLLAGHDKEVLDKTLYDLREKRLFTFPYDRVTRFSLERPPESWAFAKSGETTWALEKDPAFPVDSEQVGSAVRHITWEEAASFEEEEAGDLAPYGLDAPALRIGLQVGDTLEELHIGKAPDGKKDRRFARMTGRPQILTVKAGFLDEIPQSLEDLRAEEPEEEAEAEGALQEAADPAE